MLETIQKTPFQSYNKTYDIKSNELALNYIFLIEECIKHGFKYCSKVFATPCMHSSINSYLIDTDLSAYTCISAYGLCDFKIDYFSSIEIMEKSIALRKKILNNPKLNKHCGKCCFLPVCLGGCAYELKTNNIDITSNIVCRKKYYDFFINNFYERITKKYGVTKIE